MSPVIYIVREKYVEGEQYKAAIFGAFTKKKIALGLRKKILAEVPVIFPNVEIVPLHIGHRHEEGIHITGVFLGSEGSMVGLGHESPGA